MRGPPRTDRAADGVSGGLIASGLQRQVLPLAVRGHVRGGAAVAVGGLGPLYV